MKFKILIFCVFLVFIIVGLFFTPLCNERSTHESVVKYLDSTIVNIKEQYSDQKFVITLFGCNLLMGVDQEDSYEWNKNEINFIFKTKFNPIIYAEIEGVHYIAVIDCVADANKNIFKFYKHSELKWEEIKYSEFPKQLAVQNAWVNMGDKFSPGPVSRLRHPIGSTSIDDQFSRKHSDAWLPAGHWYRNSLTGKLWIFLERGPQFNEAETFQDDFFKDYIKKYNVYRIPSEYHN